MLQHTKNDAPHPEKKKKLQQDGRKGTITIKPNPMPARWVTHRLENSNICWCSLTVVKVLSPASGSPAWGSSIGTGNPPEIWFWRPEGFHFHGTRGNRDLTLGGPKQNVGWSPAEMWVNRGLPQGQGIGSSSAGRSPLVGNLLEAPLTHHRACIFQGWVASGQTTNRKIAQPHPSEDYQIKVLLIPAHQSKTQFFPLSVHPIRKLTQAS